jgi:hypothetical protein
MIRRRYCQHMNQSSFNLTRSRTHRAALCLAACAALLLTTPAQAQTNTPPAPISAAPAVKQAGHARFKHALRLIAQSLSMKPRELAAALKAGKSVAEVAESRNVPLATVRAAVLAPAKTKLDAAVKAGTSTQTQADQRLSKLTKRLDALLLQKRAPQP